MPLGSAVRGAACLLLLAVASGCPSGSEAPSGRLERIELRPPETRRGVGEAQRFTAIGHYAGGGTRNLTQRVAYATSDAAIARAPNAKGDRSRIEAVAPGSVAVTATDPASGVVSAPATLVVLGALERITLAPATIRRAVGQTQRLTATGHYAGGTTRNLTQHVVYRSSDPGVAAVPNAAGDKSRVEMVGAGTAVVSAVDPATGVDSRAGGGDATVVVVETTAGAR